MKETDFTRTTMRSLKALAGRFWFHKIADSGTLEFSRPRAIDVVASWNGHFIGIEFKLHKSLNAFPLKSVRLDQMECLSELHASGATALIIIGVYLGPRKRIAYSIPIDTWLQTVTVLDPKAKSVRLQDVFADYGHVLPATVTQWTQSDLIALIGRHKYDARLSRDV